MSTTKTLDEYGVWHAEKTGTGFASIMFFSLDEKRQAALLEEMASAMAGKRGPITDDEVVGDEPDFAGPIL